MHKYFIIITMIILILIIMIIIILIILIMIIVMMITMFRCDSGWPNWRLDLVDFAQKNLDLPQVLQIL